MIVGPNILKIKQGEAIKRLKKMEKIYHYKLIVDFQESGFLKKILDPVN